MLFKPTTLALLGMVASASAAISASQMTANIDQITQLSSSTDDIAKTISITSFISTAPQMINSFKEIIQTITNDVTAMNSGGNSKRSLQARQDCLNIEDVEKCIDDIGSIVEDPSEVLGKRSVKFAGKKRQSSSAYSDTEQQAVCSSFREFVFVHQALLQTVIAKHGLLSLTPFTHPMAQLLRHLESDVDTFIFGVIDTVPTCAQDVLQNKGNLDSTLANAVNTYQD